MAAVARFLKLVRNSVALAAMVEIITVTMAIGVAYALRRLPSPKLILNRLRNIRRAGSFADSVRAALTIIGLVASERIGELFLARRNQRRLIAAGGREVGASHYPLIVAVHAGWLVAMAVYVVAVRPGVHPVPLIAFIAVQPLRLWVIATLGRFWTTQIGRAHV